MAKMYFDENPDAKHDIHELKVKLLDIPMSFLTDSGVFSKTQIDFGSRVLLDNTHMEEGESLLDVGCGYGPMGLTLAKKYGVHPTLIDVNERALGLAEQNAQANHVDARIFKSDVYSALGDEKFDHIVSNPPIRAGKTVVHSVLTGAYDHLNPGGDLVIVIQKKQGAPSAQKKMEETFGNVSVVAKEKGYFILRSVKE
ncbi:class I SAM-dependent methyltransferase [Streptococcaceae bacterium ESL0687]|nr:class I SAM-dependent methyltransferase [Streptococcaceae bacterium ESL0687]